MLIRSKEEFIDLVIVTMYNNGSKIETYDLKKEITKALTNRKYENLFSFFYSKKDLDFSDELENLREKRIIKYFQNEDGSITIEITREGSHNDLNNLFKKFSKEIMNLMKSFLTEINLSDRLTCELPPETVGNYYLSNPNSIYKLDDNMRLITDGYTEELEKNIFLVENADFTIIEYFTEEQLTKFDLLYRFNDPRYIFNIVKKVLMSTKKLSYYEEKVYPELIEERNKIKEEYDGKILTYDEYDIHDIKRKLF